MLFRFESNKQTEEMIGKKEGNDNKFNFKIIQNLSLLTSSDMFMEWTNQLEEALVEAKAKRRQSRTTTTRRWHKSE